MTSEANRQQRVAVGVDGSAGSIAALGWAAKYAEATGAAVRAILAWHYPAAAGVVPLGAPAKITAEVEQEMREHLDQAIAAAYPGTDGARPEAVISTGHPAEVLIDESKNADLLVVGHRGHGAFAGLHIGSVSMHCVTSAACPVVVVRG
jgi:nucleotide-binding universal stress UspA family protein